MKTILLFVLALMVSAVGYGAEPTTIIRKPGKVGERIETVGKGAKENTVHVRPDRVVNGEVVQERIVVTGADVFSTVKAAKERKTIVKERPQPKSVKAEAVEVAVKKAMGK